MSVSIWTNFGVVEVVDRPQSQQVLSTRWASKQRLDRSYRMRLAARGFEQTVSSDADFCAGASKRTILRGNHVRCNSRNPVAFAEIVTVHLFHQPPMPRESELVHVEPAPEAQLDSSKVCLCKKAFQDSRFLFRPAVCTAHRKPTT